MWTLYWPCIPPSLRDYNWYRFWGAGHSHTRVVFHLPQGSKAPNLPAAMLLQEHKDKQAEQRIMLGIPQKDDDLIFSDFEGKPLLPDAVSHAWSKLVKRTGLEGIRVHDARHTHASLMLKQGVHPKIV